jgi:hypothetical protein
VADGDRLDPLPLPELRAGAAFRGGEEAVYGLEELIATAAQEIWGELAAESRSAPAIKTWLGHDTSVRANFATTAASPSWKSSFHGSKSNPADDGVDG